MIADTWTYVCIYIYMYIYIYINIEPTHTDIHMYAHLSVYVRIYVYAWHTHDYVLRTHTHKRFHAKQLLALSSVRFLNLWTRLTTRMQEVSQGVRQHSYRSEKTIRKSCALFIC